MKILDILLAFALGVWLALLYFGGFWLTVKHLSRVSRPSLLFFSSLLGRAGGVLFCFRLVGADGRWERLLACAAGFFLMRALLTRVFDTRAMHCGQLYGREPGRF